MKPLIQYYTRAHHTWNGVFPELYSSGRTHPELAEDYTTSKHPLYRYSEYMFRVQRIYL